jgi:FkbM family methyltransferase
VAADRARPGGGLLVRECPVPFKPRSNNGQRLVQILRVLDGAAASPPPPGRRPPSRGGTVVDVGLPVESIGLARAGYRVQAFEARRSGYEQVLERLDRDLRGRALRGRVQLHRAALSNYTGATEIYDASTSSSLLEGAVANGAIEEKKFDKEGRRTETVPVTTLDDHFRSLASEAKNAGAAAAAAAVVVVGMKVDTQGVEPEIFMGARSLLEDPARRPLAIVFEYCTRLRPFDELSVGLRLLLGLGYECYYPRGNALSRKHGASAVVTEDTEVCSDFYCTSEPLPPGNATAGAP